MEICFNKNYFLGQPIGKTDYSTVYKAIEINSNRTVCIKEIDLSTVDKRLQQGLLETVKKEVKALTIAGDGVSNIPCIFDSYYSKSDNKFYIIMQWIDGKTLRENIACSATEFLNYMIKLAETLDELHSLHINHKDIKPENILIKSGGVRLIDFNISLSLPNIIEGTPPYSAPEMNSPAGEVSRNGCDVFALGVIMYEYFTGEQPINGIHYTEDFMNPKNPQWSYFTTAKETCSQKGLSPLSDEIDNIITKCMKKSPADRYNELKYLIKDLRNALRGYYAKR